MDNPIIIKETDVNVPASRVWQAITAKEEIKQWSFDIKEFEPIPEYEFQFWGGDEKKQWLHLCKVIEAIPHEKLSFTWRYADTPGNTLVTYEIFEEDGKTRIRLTHQGLETFPDIPELAYNNFVEGWNHIIGTLLKEYLETNKKK
ncbi:MAG TPA: SRPBCC domain-containing protein [Ignavibacteriaceae bacterium]|nr:SRPBCC domain-containing protein [Ignavibacteriaceae bacterium]